MPNKAKITGLILIALVLAVLAVNFASKGGGSAVLLENAVAHPVGEGSVAVTLSMSNAGGPVSLLDIESPEAESARLTGEGPVALPAGSSPSLALDGVHVRLEGVSGALDEGRLIPLTLIFSDGEAATKARVERSEAHSHAGHAMMIEAPGMSLDLKVEPDGDGWLVTIETPGLELVQEAADGPHMPGQGHGHLYLNGLKLQRLYEPQARIGKLPPGRHQVTVSLNANDHRAYATEGAPLEATVTIDAR